MSVSGPGLTRGELSVAEGFMHRALQLARRARGRTWPNPMVGSVVVRRGRVVGQGYHHKAGLPHAEVAALRDASGAARGADLYATLEPCHRHGRTPPCTDSILRSGVRRVFVGARDSNPRESGAGLEVLRAAGLKVYAGILEQRCRELNEVYDVFISQGRPFVTVKAAASLDGRLAPFTGDARWISSLESRAFAHRLRARNQAIMVGAGTVRKDDPALNVRHVEGPDPAVAVLDTRLTTSPRAHLVRLERGAPVWIYCSRRAPAARARSLQRAGAQVARVPCLRGRLVLEAVLADLLQRGVYRMLVEGGASVIGSLLGARAVDRLELMMAGILLGSEGVPLARWKGPGRVSDAPRIEPLSSRRRGPDLHISGKLVWPGDKG